MKSFDSSFYYEILKIIGLEQNFKDIDKKEFKHSVENR